MTRPRKSPAPPKRGPGRPPRGPGRPPLDPNGDTVPLTIRITEAHYRTLRRLIDEGHGPQLADAVRWAIEQA